MNPSLTRKAGRPVPPDKGSFPLDHEGKNKTEYNPSVFYCFGTLKGECKEYMKQYMQCLKESKNDNHQCRSESRQYLQCRMEK